MLELIAGQPTDFGGVITMLLVGLSVGGMTLHKIFYAAKKDRRDDATGEVQKGFVEGMGTEVATLRKENRDLLTKVSDLRVKLAMAEAESAHHKAMVDMYSRTIHAGST